MTRPRLGEFLRTPGVAQLATRSYVGRLGFGILPLALLLDLVSTEHSFAAAGLATGAFGLATLSAPLKTRLLEERGPRLGIGGLAVLGGVALGLVVVASSDGAPEALTLVLVVAAGLLVPPLGPISRDAWSEVVGRRSEHVRLAWSFDSVVEEVIFTLGPAAASGLSAVSRPWVALLTSAALITAGGVALSRTASVHLFSTRARRESASRSPSERARSRHIAPTAAVALGAGACGLGAGGTFVGVALFASQHHIGSFTGLLLATWSAGSVAGTALFARAPSPGRPYRRHVIVLVGMTIGLALMGFANTWYVLVPILLLSGATVGPSLISCYILADSLAGTKRTASVNAAINSAYNLGNSLGEASITPVAKYGLRLFFLSAAALVGAATVLNGWLATVKNDASSRSPSSGP